MDFEGFAFHSRLDSIKESITRARFSFLLNLVASLTVTLSEWNGYFSWYRCFALIPHCQNRDAADPKRIVQEQLIKSWVKSLIVNTTSLGISDLAFVEASGPMILLIIWCRLRHQREPDDLDLLIDT
jgi:hypothetical protein